MKNISSMDLANRVSGNVEYPAYLISITLINGTVINATTGALDITMEAPTLPNGVTIINQAGNPPTTFKASPTYGSWEVGVVKSEVNFGLTTNDTTLTLEADQTVLFPGTSKPIMSLVQTGFFDAAKVLIYKVFMPTGQYGNTTAGGEILLSGVITKFEASGRSKWQFTVADYNYYLNLKTPPNVIMRSCRWTLFSPGCTLNRSSFTIGNTVGGGSTDQLIVPGTTWANPAPYYNQGMIFFTSGGNAGLYYTIVSQDPSTGAFTLNVPTLFDVMVGDTFAASPGCDKTSATCQNKFANLINFGGFPFVPVPETAV